MDTDPYYSAKSPLQVGRELSLCVLPGPHASCVLGLRHAGHAKRALPGTEPPRPLRVSAVRFLGLRLCRARFIYVHRSVWFVRFARTKSAACLRLRSLSCIAGQTPKEANELMNYGICVMNTDLDLSPLPGQKHARPGTSAFLGVPRVKLIPGKFELLE